MLTLPRKSAVVLIAALLLIAATLACPLTFAQQLKDSDIKNGSYYSAFWETTLAGTPGVLTIQLPARSGQKLHLQSVNVLMPQDGDVTIERNGTAATATSMTAVGLNTSLSPTATVYRNSDVGVGTVVTKVSMTTGNNYGDLTTSVLAAGQATVQNFTVRTGNLTGVLRITLFWAER